MYRIAPIVTILAACALFWLTASAAADPYAIPNTDVRAMRSKHTDADYSFALVRNVVQHFVERDDLPPMILVAIAYPGAATNRSTYRMNRYRRLHTRLRARRQLWRGVSEGVGRRGKVSHLHCHRAGSLDRAGFPGFAW